MRRRPPVFIVRADLAVRAVLREWVAGGEAQHRRVFVVRQQATVAVRIFAREVVPAIRQAVTDLVVVVMPAGRAPVAGVGAEKYPRARPTGRVGILDDWHAPEFRPCHLRSGGDRDALLALGTHFECEVYGANAEGPQTISITDNNNTSSVNTNQNATLVFVLDPQRSDVVYLKMFGERAWSMRGCDITSAPR